MDWEIKINQRVAQIQQVEKEPTWSELLGMACQCFFRWFFRGWLFGLGFWVAFLLWLYVVALTCEAAAGEPGIPRAALQYRAQLIRTARAVWGMEAPVAVFAAQIHTESRWKADAKSPAGAQGLAQFMPQTAKWIPTAFPSLASEAFSAQNASESECPRSGAERHLVVTGKPMPFNPGWAMRALCSYDKWLWERVPGAENDVERMAFVLSAYNGGLGWVNRDRKLARQQGLDAGRWFDSVATVNAGRSKAAWTENRNYPRLILKERQYAYVKAGWGRGV